MSTKEKEFTVIFTIVENADRENHESVVFQVSQDQSEKLIKALEDAGFK